MAFFRHKQFVYFYKWVRKFTKYSIYLIYIYFFLKTLISTKRFPVRTFKIMTSKRWTNNTLQENHQIEINF